MRLSTQACTWVWDDWDDRDSKGIWEVYASVYIFNAHLLILLYVFAMLATSPATIQRNPQRAAAEGGGGRRPPPLYGGWGGGKHSENIQMYQQMCVEYEY